MVSPFPPPEISHAQPRLIQVQDGFSGQQQLEELHSELLTEDEVLGGVGMNRYMNDLFEAHLQVLFHYALDLRFFALYLFSFI